MQNYLYSLVKLSSTPALAKEAQDRFLERLRVHLVDEDSLAYLSKVAERSRSLVPKTGGIRAKGRNQTCWFVCGFHPVLRDARFTGAIARYTTCPSNSFLYRAAYGGAVAPEFRVSWAKSSRSMMHSLRQHTKTTVAEVLDLV